MHHTKEKGDIGVLKAHADMAEKGYKILTPLSEHLPFDFVAYKDNRLIRVQVKYVSINNGTMDIDLRSQWSDRHGIHINPPNKSEIDLVCVYCPDKQKCYYINMKEIKSNQFILRVNKPINNQKKGVHLAENYEHILI